MARALRASKEQEGVVSGICASRRSTGVARQSAAEGLESLY
ncbi:hypothetical protein A2U01_0088425 [Trifolium medium]|uniref:Uncharacterized protein n=1 Tax=Trifolium medium TaxID=97028 RepID=A0A392U342_9FABA|nr:hypothetical protein [Trifolium medium]